jgi:ribosomal protein S18 acetylase RimI-like enzyme
MINGLIIRKKETPDNAAAAELIACAFREKYMAFSAGNWTKALKIAEAEMRFRGRMDNLFVAELDGKVVGAIEIISIEIPGIPSGDMLSIYYKHLGLGKGTRAAYLLSLLTRTIDENEACVSSLAVAEEAQRAGVARALLSSGGNFARELDKERLTLWVNETNLPAISLYESEGFKTEAQSSSPLLKKFFELESWRQMTKDISTIPQ